MEPVFSKMLQNTWAVVKTPPLPSSQVIHLSDTFFVIIAQCRGGGKRVAALPLYTHGWRTRK